MSSAIFFRMETYGLRARARVGRNATPWRSINGVVAEALRRPGGAPHVKGATAVEVIAGDDPAEIGRLAIDQAKRAIDRRGHRLREDGAALVACVASHHVAASVLVSDHDALEGYLDWRDRTVAWVKERWGGHRHAIIEHRDEAHWHLHVLVVPQLDEIGHLLVDAIHPGIAARDRLQQEGASTATQNLAYRKAMAALLDSYHGAVGAPSGQTRKGSAPRGRLTREQALTERRQRETEAQLRKQERTLIVASHSLQRRENGLAAQVAAIGAQERRLAAQRADIKRQRRQLKDEAQTLRASSAAERAKHEAAWAQTRTQLREAAKMVRIASAANRAEHERLVEVRREAMAADPVRLTDENARLRASLDEAKRRLAVLEGEREEIDLTPPRRVGNI
jgi:hypothetical protein